MGILDGKRILVTGVLTDASIAFHVARVAQEQGATVVLTAFPRPTLVERIAKRLPAEAPVIELDVTDVGQLDSLADRVREHVDGLDGVVHSIGERAAVRARRQLPRHPVGGRRQGGARLHLLAEVAGDGGAAADGRRRLGRRPRLRRVRRLAGLRLDGRGQGRARVLRPLPGPRPRPAAGPGQPGRGRPAKTMAAKSIPGFEKFEDVWAQRAPLGWDIANPDAAARACVALLSDWFPATTGEIVHVDGGRARGRRLSAGPAASLRRFSLRSGRLVPILHFMGGSAAETPTSPDEQPAGGLRASDADRDQVVSRLRDEFVAGRLSHETFLHRMDAGARGQAAGGAAAAARRPAAASRQRACRPQAAGRRSAGWLRGAWSRVAGAGGAARPTTATARHRAAHRSRPPPRPPRLTTGMQAAAPTAGGRSPLQFPRGSGDQFSIGRDAELRPGDRRHDRLPAARPARADARTAGC